MEPAEIVRHVTAHEHRRGGSDAERRAALGLADLLRSEGGRSARVHVQPRWVRPHGALVQAALALLGVAASVVSVGTPRVGLGLALTAVVLLAGDVTGRARVLRVLTAARATQDIESRDRRTDARVRLVICASTDAPGTGLLDAGALPRLGARLRRRTRGRLPGPLGWLAAALVLVAAGTAARVAGAEGLLLGAVQLVPTVGALLLAAMLLDRDLARAQARGAGANASAAAAALELAARLRARPPRALAVDVVLAGAGEPEGLGFAAWRAARAREGLRADEVAVLAFGPCAAGEPVWLEREGLVRARRPHPQLLALARRVGPPLGARAGVARTASPARIATGRRWPAIALRTDGAAEDADEVDPRAIERTVTFAEALVRGLDDELGPPPARPAPAPESARAARRRGARATS